MKLKDKYYFFVFKTMHNFKIGYNFVKHFFNQTYIVVVFNEKASKAILFGKINRLLRSNDTGLDTQRFD